MIITVYFYKLIRRCEWQLMLELGLGLGFYFLRLVLALRFTVVVTSVSYVYIWDTKFGNKSSLREWLARYIIDFS